MRVETMAIVVVTVRKNVRDGDVVVRTEGDSGEI